jgi:hypothetical protein
MSTPTTATTNAPTNAPAGVSDVPSPAVLVQAAKIAIQQDKPIQLDYYIETATGKACIGEDAETKEKVLIKNIEEYTSLIQKVFKVADDYIIMTENTLYIVSGKVQKKKLAMSSLKSMDD